MIIIFEGPENVGKTTQIRKLPHLLHKQFHVLNSFNYNSSYFNIDHVMNMDNYYEKTDIFINNPQHHFILDRFHLGEYVYGNLFRNQINADVFYFEEYFLEKLKDIHKIYLITLMADVDFIINNDDSNSLHNNIKENVIKEIDLFNIAYKNSKIRNKILINITDSSIEEVSNKILNFINQNE